MASVKQVIEPLLEWLRGDYNSVRYRFYARPKEEMTYFWYRVRGRTWIDFYSRRMNSMVNKCDRVSDKYLAHGSYQAEYLVAHGLKEQDHILDYGCGVLRLAAALFPILPTIHYTGVDISAERLSKGKTVLSEKGISSDRYDVIVVRDCNLRELEGQRFDMVWAKSVLTHMPLDDIRVMLASLRPLLNDRAHVFFTFAEREKIVRKNVKDFYYPRDVLRNACENAGYRFEIMADWDPKIRGDVMVRLIAESV